MKGQGSFSSADVISSDVDKLILDALEEIRDQYNIDLTDNLNLLYCIVITHCVINCAYQIQHAVKESSGRLYQADIPAGI